ncbi:hypothetical protein [Reyranella soli]|uniref:Uncharacterized protein n=1 Tax=Reyranella soli TaxID=1230389 RepID=A0A512NEI4_9HYPH|nr:hypothetical protein [Reyranella soli]GEP57332.1 hypothetical protein RSO01_44980 [Reyranella soli]
MQPRPETNPLLLELVEAHRKARCEDVAGALDACGLHQHGGPIFGIEFVDHDAHNYAPAPGGKPSIIVPHFEDGRLLDLVAVGLRSRACRTRAGVCTVLGGEWLDYARDHETAARIYPNPLAWLLAGRRGAVIVDWRSARYVLADVPELVCTDKALAERIDKAMRQPVHMPRLIVGQAPAAMANDKQESAAEIEAREAWAAKTAEYKIRKAATKTHPYLDSIGFPRLRGLVHEGLLLVPMRLDGRVVCLQEIDADGTARFLSGGRTAGASFTMGEGRSEILCVDYAAALSIRAALSAMHMPARATCCFTAANMEAIAERRRHAVVFADHDAKAVPMSEGLPALQRLLLDLLQGWRGQAA